MAAMSYDPAKFYENFPIVTSVSHLLRTSNNTFSYLSLKTLDIGVMRRDLTVSVKLRKVKKHNIISSVDADSSAEGETIAHLLSVNEAKPKPITLEIENPLIALRKQIIQVRMMATETGLDFSKQILSLESNYEQALKKLYMEKNTSQELELTEELSTALHLESDLNYAIIEKLEREVGHEYSEAAKALGLKDKLVILHEEFDQNIDPTLQDEIQKLNDEFNQNLPQAPNYAKLKFKLDMLKEISKARDIYRNEEIEFTDQKRTEQNVDRVDD